MTEEFRQTIYNNLKLRETEDLLQIWKSNDHVEWNESTFEIIKQILLERIVDIPVQNEAIYKHEGGAQSEYNLSSDKDISKYLDPVNAPEFYDPVEVLLLAKMMKRVSLIIIGIIFLQSLFNLPHLFDAIHPYINMGDTFLQDILTWIITIPTFLVGLILMPILYYLPLKALGNILKILVEMEFRSRGVE